MRYAPCKKHKCQFYGLTGVHEIGKDCPAFGKKCHGCNKWNHFSSMCKPGNNHSHKNRKQKSGGGKKERIKKTTNHAESTSSDDEHLSKTKKIREMGKDSGNYQTVAVRLNEDVVMEADNVADVNIMDEHQFKAFIHRTNQSSFEQGDSLKENVVNQSPKDPNQQLEDYLPLSMALAQETPRLAQDMPRPTKDKLRPAQDVPRGGRIIV